MPKRADPTTFYKSMKKTLTLLTISILHGAAYAGPFEPAAGQANSTAISKNDPAIVGWATGWKDYLPGAEVEATWQTPDKALGSAVGNSFDIVTLGRGGSITLTFDKPISNGPGADFSVFENGINDSFLELAWVEVSSDGSTFSRFPGVSFTASPVGGFGSIDPTDIDGFASKYRQGFGTPFDLENLNGVSGLDINAIHFVRLVDIVGDGTVFDDFPSNQGGPHPIYDQFPTVLSAGFDLDAVAVINSSPGPARQPEPQSISPMPGLWLNPQKPDHGLDIRLVDNNLQVLWATYSDLDGNPIWYWASNSFSEQDTSWEAVVYEIHSQQDNTIAAFKAGAIALEFDTKTTALFEWMLDGVNTAFASEPIQLFSDPEISSAASTTGLWLGSNPVWATSIYDIGDNQSALLFFYDTTGDPRWAFGSHSDLSATTYSLASFFDGYCPSCTKSNINSKAVGTLTQKFFSSGSSQISTDISFEGRLEGDWQRDNFAVTLLQ